MLCVCGFDPMWTRCWDLSAIYLDPIHHCLSSTSRWKTINSRPCLNPNQLQCAGIRPDTFNLIIPFISRAQTERFNGITSQSGVAKWKTSRRFLIYLPHDKFIDIAKIYPLCIYFSDFSRHCSVGSYSPEMIWHLQESVSPHTSI